MLRIHNEPPEAGKESVTVYDAGTNSYFHPTGVLTQPAQQVVREASSHGCLDIKTSRTPLFHHLLCSRRCTAQSGAAGISRSGQRWDRKWRSGLVSLRIQSCLACRTWASCKHLLYVHVIVVPFRNYETINADVKKRIAINETFHSINSQREDSMVIFKTCYLVTAPV